MIGIEMLMYEIGKQKMEELIDEAEKRRTVQAHTSKSHRFTFDKLKSNFSSSKSSC